MQPFTGTAICSDYPISVNIQQGPENEQAGGRIIGGLCKATIPTVSAGFKAYNKYCLFFLALIPWKMSWNNFGLENVFSMSGKTSFSKYQDDLPMLLGIRDTSLFWRKAPGQGT
jgi:hypothetical protein